MLLAVTHVISAGPFFPKQKKLVASFLPENGLEFLKDSNSSVQEHKNGHLDVRGKTKNSVKTTH